MSKPLKRFIAPPFAAALALMLTVTIALLGKPAALARPSGQGLNGSYTTSPTSPRVLFSEADLSDIASRIRNAGSFSSLQFARLSDQVKRDLAASPRWLTTYAGCDIRVYLLAFSYEASTDVMTPQQLNAAIGLKDNDAPPRGAAHVAARAALYAALTKAGAPLPPGAPDPRAAAELARRILLAWAKNGFKDTSGRQLAHASQFCIDGQVSAISKSQVGLQISRGVVYSAMAQDLISYFGGLNDADVSEINTFHRAMYELIRNAMNYRFTTHKDYDCNYYSNHVASQLAGLLAVARLLDDKALFDGALFGGPGSNVTLPWIRYFDRAIYGAQEQLNSCYPNTGQDGSSSRPFFQLNSVVPGEIDDRYRNSTPAQAIGYAMETLIWFYRMAEIMRLSGYDAYRYQGHFGQSIALATNFYLCFARTAGFGADVTAASSGNCPGFAQYDGKIVNGVEDVVPIWLYRIANDKPRDELDVRAKSVLAKRTPDPLLFGRWLD